MGVGSEPRLLIAEDEDRLRRLLEMLLGNKGYALTLARDGGEALEKFGSGEGYDLVITDLRMPNMDGMQLLQAVKERAPQTPVIVITAFGSIESAVEAMRAGAIDYITKPFEEQALTLAIERALNFGRILEENRELREQIREKTKTGRVVAESEAMRQVLELAARVGPSNTTVIIYGESGTGKELVTRAVHEASSRSSGPFIAINCAAIPENLLESELFGHEKGAFTGATERKVGKFELAHGGTLFLDEIGEMDLGIQAKLLRAIELQEFERVGGTRTIKADIRFIAATNKDLRRKVDQGLFREDLYFRLNVFPLYLPALRDRPDDILPLTRFFIEKFCREMGKKPPTVISPEAQTALLQYRWPGNVRELQNTIERAMILLRGDTLTPAELGLSGNPYWSLTPSAPAPGGPCAAAAAAADPSTVFGQPSVPSGPTGGRFLIPASGFSLEQHEKELLLQALERENENKSRAARLLGISRAKLRYRLEKFGIVDREEEPNGS